MTSLRSAVPIWLLLALCYLPSASAASFVVNPSFEANYNDVWPHYGAIDNWGGSGVNDASGPFHNAGTPVPDRTRIGFMQGSAQITQAISGLEVGKQYWIQFYYDARACCGGTIDLITEWDDAPLDTLSSLVAVDGGFGYRFRNVTITPGSEGGTLKFRTVAVGDATALMDGVSIVQRDAGQVLVRNPSFESSDTPEAPGYLTALAGWTTVGNVGVNDAAGPFADNGTIPEQDHVVFMQQAASIEQVLGGLVAGQSYTVTFGYNARSGGVPHLRVSVNGTALFNQDVSPVGGVAAYRAGSFNFTPAGVAGTATTATINFEQTEAVADVTVLLDNIKISGQVIDPIPNLKIGPPQLELAVGMAQPVTVTVSGKRREQGVSVVVLRANNPAVATLAGADVDGNVTLTFPAGPAGGPDLALTVDATGVGRGTTGITVVDDGGHDGVDGSVIINVVGSFVRNPSFEANPPGPFPSYGPIAAWASTGGSGVNNLTGPFADNGVIPDGAQVGFVQGTQTLSQTIVGLTPGQRYWLQFFYNARAAGGTAISLTTRFAGTVLSTIPDIDAAGGYRPHSVAFVPTAETGLLEFAAQTAVDATVLLDGVNIVQRDQGEIVVMNSSFEASGVPTGVGYLSGPMAGWTKGGGGGKGINIDTVGPFTDNGIAGEQDRVGFLQGTGSLTQTIDGLTPGAAYTLSISVNARNCCTAGTDTPYAILIDGTPLIEESLTPVGAGVPYLLKDLPFTAAAASVELQIDARIPDDHSLLFDTVRIRPVGVGPGTSVTLSIAVVGGNSVELRWPTSAPASLKLKTSPSGLTGSWVNDTNPPSIIGGQNVVIEPFDGALRFFRLAAP